MKIFFVKGKKRFDKNFFADRLKSMKKNINGWLIIDKPYNMSSTQAVTRLKKLLNPQKIGHAGTLDPLATGVLPIAFGSATKTIPFVMNGKKTYVFEVSWGYQTETDDAEGAVSHHADLRPSREQIEKIIPAFTGTILQTPPLYSALKVNGKRAYALARKGEEVILKPRPVQIDSLKILTHHEQKTVFEVVCEKGTYVRSIGREMGKTLGCYGFVSSLRRIKCGPFNIQNAILLENFEKKVYNGADLNLISVLTALDGILVLAVDRTDLNRLAHGQAISADKFLSDQKERLNRLSLNETVGLTFKNSLVALAKCDNGRLKPFHVFVGKI